MLFDTHTHLNDPQFAGILDQTIERSQEAGIDGMIVVGVDLPSSRRAVEIAAERAGVYAAVGIQPNYCADVSEHDWQSIERLANEACVVAIGETGLDRYWDHCPLATQREFFHRHMDFARARSLPFIVHMRDCNADILAVFAQQAAHAPFRGVMHSFTGDLEMAKKCVEYGLMISFAGMVTFRKSEALRAISRQVPIDRLLLETDCPYLSPHPMRGQRPNEPALLVHTAQCLAETRQIPVDELCRTTTRNARRLFGIE